MQDPASIVFIASIVSTLVFSWFCKESVFVGGVLAQTTK
jgi:hypothetical protein